MMNKRIAVVGGGTAGYFSALFLKKKYPLAKVTLIESSKHPIIGVGEATTPKMLRFLHRDLGIPVDEFMQKVKPTIKLGVRFNWGQPASYYINPFGVTSLSHSIHYTKTVNNCSVLSMLMMENKAPLVLIENKFKPIKLNKGFAYHIDNKLLVQFLQEKRKSFDIDHIDCEIKGVRLNKDNSIDCLVDEKGNSLQFDFYVDCSGFRSLLLGDYLKTDFITYSDALFTNKAVVGIVKNNGNPIPYTTATTMKNGWLWNTPLRTEDHLGYVYDSSFCTDEEALIEFKEKCPLVENTKVINFKSGRRAKCWSGNVLAVGNSYAFIEPLESTGIHMILTHLERFVKITNKFGFSESSKMKFNDKIANEWDYLKDFIAIHFKFNFNKDTPFWRKCRNISTQGITEYLDYYDKFGPLAYNKDHPLYKKMDSYGLFGVFAFDLNVVGCGYYKKSLVVNEDKINPTWVMHHKFNKALVEKASSHNELLFYLENERTDFIKNWFGSEKE